MQEHIKTIIEQIEIEFPDWKMQLKNNGDISSCDEKLQNLLMEMIQALNVYYKEGHEDIQDILNKVSADKEIAELLYIQVEQTLVYYKAFRCMRNKVLANDSRIKSFVEDIFQMYLLRYNPEILEKYRGFFEDGCGEIDELIWAFDSLTDYYVRRFFVKSAVAEDFQNETGLPKELSCYYAELYEQSFNELRLNAILNGIQGNQSRLEQIEQMLLSCI